MLSNLYNGKEAFCTAPTLAYPSPDLPFVVEVDASTTGVGAVLAQRQGKLPILHPCAFYSKKLSLAEHNYNIGNHELLCFSLLCVFLVTYSDRDMNYVSS